MDSYRTFSVPNSEIAEWDLPALFELIDCDTGSTGSKMIIVEGEWVHCGFGELYHKQQYRSGTLCME